MGRRRSPAARTARHRRRGPRVDGTPTPDDLECPLDVVDPDRRGRPRRVLGRSRDAGRGPRGVGARRGSALARAPRLGHGHDLGGRGGALHARPRPRDRCPARGRHRGRRRVHRLHGRRQHEPDHRPDRRPALPGAARHLPRDGPRPRGVVRRAGTAHHLPDELRHRDVRAGARGGVAVYVVIAGAGKVGWNLARELMSKRHEVTVIESDRSRYLTVEQELEHAIQYGDATELWVLERAGINRADLTIAVTGDDEDNLLICQLAKEKYLCERIIARVNNPRNRQYFELLGIQPAVSATDLILRLIEHEVPSYGTVHLLVLRDEQLEIIEVEVPDNSPVIGRRINEIELPDGALIISILREGKGFVPKADTVIQDGDEVLLVLDPGLEDRITEQFASSRRDAA